MSTFAHPAGRFAPSPSGDLHFGNLRTAVLAWQFARSTGRKFYIRIEDIDTERSKREYAQRQLEDLAAVGIEWDEPVIYQSDRSAAYEEALSRLKEKDLVYECYCSRKDIREAASAPHAQPGLYPGTCRDLSEKERAYRRSQLAQQNRIPSLRLKAQCKEWTIKDYYHGDYSGPVDDVILKRGGNTNQAQAGDWAYNLAVVVDDGYQNVDQVVRGEDLLFSAPTQAYLAHELGIAQPEYVHVPLVLNDKGCRLAKRDGAVTLREMAEGAGVQRVVEQLAESVGCGGATSLREPIDRFDPLSLPQEPWVWEDGL